jgi:glycosyltransferase involved in cell wall biosynthesis
MLLEAVAPLVRQRRLRLDIIGDGPLMPALRSYVQGNSLEPGVKLHGWITHDKLQPVMSASQMFLFPSVREFGGGVVLEAMALGLVPVVIDYAGPGELVTEATGFKIPMDTRSEIISRLRAVVTSICNQPAQLTAKSLSARSRVRELFTWDVKARQMIEIYEWALGQREYKPQFFD